MVGVLHLTRGFAAEVPCIGKILADRGGGEAGHETAPPPGGGESALDVVLRALPQSHDLFAIGRGRGHEQAGLAGRQVGLERLHIRQCGGGAGGPAVGRIAHQEHDQQARRVIPVMEHLAQRRPFGRAELEPRALADLDIGIGPRRQRAIGPRIHPPFRIDIADRALGQAGASRPGHQCAGAHADHADLRGQGQAAVAGHLAQQIDEGHACAETELRIAQHQHIGRSRRPGLHRCRTGKCGQHKEKRSDCGPHLEFHCAAGPTGRPRCTAIRGPRHRCYRKAGGKRPAPIGRKRPATRSRIRAAAPPPRSPGDPAARAAPWCRGGVLLPTMAALLTALAPCVKGQRLAFRWETCLARRAACTGRTRGAGVAVPYQRIGRGSCGETCRFQSSGPPGRGLPPRQRAPRLATVSACATPTAHRRIPSPMLGMVA